MLICGSGSATTVLDFEQVANLTVLSVCCLYASMPVLPDNKKTKNTDPT